MNIFNKKETREKRLLLRKNQTDAEKRLWDKLRNKQLFGHKFFRQFGIGSYIADFYCPTVKLVVEVDGGQHFTYDGKEYDEERKSYMLSMGIKTMRVTNEEVLKNIDSVVEGIVKEVAASVSK